MRLLLHLLHPHYLYAQNAAPEGRLGASALLLAAGLLAAAGIAWVWHRRAPGSAPWPGVMLAAALAGAGLTLARPMVAGALSARVWSLSAAGVAVAAGLGAAARRWALARGWAACGERAERAAGHTPLRVLWPILGAGGAVLAEYLLRTRAGLDLAPYQAFPYPDPWSPWFHPPTMLASGVAGTLLLALRAAGARWLAILGVALPLLAGGWYLGTVATHGARGATGSDAYCYLQMAQDLAETSSPLRRFPLLTLAREAGVPDWPTLHVGYQVVAPRNARAPDVAATVWPAGWPALLAPLYALGGERLALWGAPLLLLAGASLTYLAPGALWPALARGQRRLAGGLAAALLLTSYEALQRSLVPLADAAALTLTIGTLVALAMAYRAAGAAAGPRAGDPAGAGGRHPPSTRAALPWRAASLWAAGPLWAAVAGLALGLGYLVRHPQLPLALAVLPLVLYVSRSSRQGRPPSFILHPSSFLLSFAALALLVALPDLLYHAGVFGSPWTAESPEWHLLSIRHIPATVGPMLGELLARREFGYLAPFALYGLWRHLHHSEQRPLALAALAGGAGVLLFNLSYSAVRLRDLLALYPLLALWAAAGAVELISRARGGAGPVVATLLVVALAARTVGTLGLPWQGELWTFGQLTAIERGELARLGDDLPPEALVLTGLHSGAVERYAGRPTARPDAWTDEELRRFGLHAQARGYRLFLLDEGEEGADTLARLGGLATLEPLGAYALRAMGRGGQPVEQEVRLYRIGMRVEN